MRGISSATARKLKPMLNPDARPESAKSSTGRSSSSLASLRIFLWISSAENLVPVAGPDDESSPDPSFPLSNGSARMVGTRVEEPYRQTVLSSGRFQPLRLHLRHPAREDERHHLRGIRFDPLHMARRNDKDVAGEPI